jgi:hypothetical protein
LILVTCTSIEAPQIKLTEVKISCRKAVLEFYNHKIGKGPNPHGIILGAQAGRVLMLAPGVCERECSHFPSRHACAPRFSAQVSNSDNGTLIGELYMIASIFRHKRLFPLVVIALTLLAHTTVAQTTSYAFAGHLSGGFPAKGNYDDRRPVYVIWFTH